MNTDDPKFPRLLTVDATAAILGVTTARGYELARTGILPVVKMGRQVRVDERRLLDWIDGGGAALPGGWKKAP